MIERVITIKELHFKLNDDCYLFQAEIFLILKAIEASDSESYMIKAMFRRSGVSCGSFTNARSG